MIEENLYSGTDTEYMDTPMEVDTDISTSVGYDPYDEDLYMDEDMDFDVEEQDFDIEEDFDVEEQDYDIEEFEADEEISEGMTQDPTQPTPPAAEDNYIDRIFTKLSEKKLFKKINSKEELRVELERDPKATTETLFIKSRDSKLASRNILDFQDKVYDELGIPKEKREYTYGALNELFRDIETTGYRSDLSKQYRVEAKGTSATGAYQIMWGDHEQDIKRITGVKDRADFLNKPEAQDKYMEYLFSNQYNKRDVLDKIKDAAINIYGFEDFTDEHAMYVLHHEGPGRGKDRFIEGKVPDANKKGLERGFAMIGEQAHLGIIDVDSTGMPRKEMLERYSLSRRAGTDPAAAEETETPKTPVLTPSEDLTSKPSGMVPVGRTAEAKAITVPKDLQNKHKIRMTSLFEAVDWSGNKTGTTKNNKEKARQESILDIEGLLKTNFGSSFVDTSPVAVRADIAGASFVPNSTVGSLTKVYPQDMVMAAVNNHNMSIVNKALKSDKGFSGKKPDQHIKESIKTQSESLGSAAKKAAKLTAGRMMGGLKVGLKYATAQEEDIFMASLDYVNKRYPKASEDHKTMLAVGYSSQYLANKDIEEAKKRVGKPPQEKKVEEYNSTVTEVNKIITGLNIETTVFNEKQKEVIGSIEGLVKGLGEKMYEESPAAKEMLDKYQAEFGEIQEKYQRELAQKPTYRLMQESLQKKLNSGEIDIDEANRQLNEYVQEQLENNEKYREEKDQFDVRFYTEQQEFFKSFVENNDQYKALVQEQQGLVTRMNSRHFDDSKRVEALKKKLAAMEKNLDAGNEEYVKRIETELANIQQQRGKSTMDLWSSLNPMQKAGVGTLTALNDIYTGFVGGFLGSAGKAQIAARSQEVRNIVPNIEFDGVNSITDWDWWTTKAIPAFTFTASFFIPSAGVFQAVRGATTTINMGRIASGITGVVAGAAANRFIEGGVEKNLLSSDLISMGMDPALAEAKGNELFKATVGLLGLDAIQFAAMFVPVGGGVRPMIGKFAATLVSENIEENIQESSTSFQTEMAMKDARMDTTDIYRRDDSLVQRMYKFAQTDEGKEVMAISTLMGAGFGTIGLRTDIQGIRRKNTLTALLQNMYLNYSLTEKMLEDKGLMPFIREYAADVEKVLRENFQGEAEERIQELRRSLRIDSKGKFSPTSMEELDQKMLQEMQADPQGFLEKRSRDILDTVDTLQKRGLITAKEAAEIIEQSGKIKTFLSEVLSNELLSTDPLRVQQAILAFDDATSLQQEEQAAPETSLSKDEVLSTESNLATALRDQGLSGITGARAKKPETIAREYLNTKKKAELTDKEKAFVESVEAKADTFAAEQYEKTKASIKTKKEAAIGSVSDILLGKTPLYAIDEVVVSEQEMEDLLNDRQATREAIAAGTLLRIDNNSLLKKKLNSYLGEFDKDTKEWNTKETYGELINRVANDKGLPAEQAKELISGIVNNFVNNRLTEEERTDILQRAGLPTNLSTEEIVQEFLKGDNPVLNNEISKQAQASNVDGFDSLVLSVSQFPEFDNLGTKEASGRLEEYNDEKQALEKELAYEYDRRYPDNNIKSVAAKANKMKGEKNLSEDMQASIDRLDYINDVVGNSSVILDRAKAADVQRPAIASVTNEKELNTFMYNFFFAGSVARRSQGKTDQEKKKIREDARAQVAALSGILMKLAAQRLGTSNRSVFDVIREMLNQSVVNATNAMHEGIFIGNKDIESLVDRMKEVFPKTFKNALVVYNLDELPEGVVSPAERKVGGFIKDLGNPVMIGGKKIERIVYINGDIIPTKQRLGVAIHETLGHVFWDALKNISKGKGKEAQRAAQIMKRGEELVTKEKVLQGKDGKPISFLEYVQSIKEYQSLDMEGQIEEAVMSMLETYGPEALNSLRNEAVATGFAAKVADWLKEMYNLIQDKLRKYNLFNENIDLVNLNMDGFVKSYIATALAGGDLLARNSVLNPAEGVRLSVGSVPAIKKELSKLPDFVKNIIKVVDKLPKFISDGTKFSIQKVFDKTGAQINNPELKGWLGVFRSLVDLYGLKSEQDLTNKITDLYNNLKNDIKDYQQYVSINEESKQEISNWESTLDEMEIPIQAKHAFLYGVYKELRTTQKRRSGAIIPPVNKIALQTAYNVMAKNPSSYNRAFKVYKSNMLAAYLSDFEQIPSSQGSGFWVKIPKTKESSPKFKKYKKIFKAVSPKQWCTASSHTASYLSNYDNYLLVVDGAVVVGIEVEQKTDNEGRRLLKDVTNTANESVASIKYLKETLDFMEEENLNPNDRAGAIAAAKEYAAQNLSQEELDQLEYGEDEDNQEMQMAMQARTVEQAIEVLSLDTLNYEFLNEELQSNLDVIKFTIQSNIESVQYIRKKYLKQIQDFLAEVASKDHYIVEYLPKSVINKNIALAAIKKNWSALYLLPDVFKNDKEVVLEAVSQDGNALQYVPDALKSDKEVILAAVRQDGYALLYASDDLKKDKEVVLAAVRQYGYALLYASDDLQKDKEVVLEAVRQNGSALLYASDDLKKDKEVVLEAVRQNGDALLYASDDLKKDKEVVLEAVRQNGSALRHVLDDLQNNKEVVLAAVRQYGYALKYASNDLKKDKEVVLTAVHQYGEVLEYVSWDLRNDKEVVLAAVRQNGRALDFVSEDLQNNKEVVLAAVRQYGYTLKYASNDLKKDKEVVLAAVRQDGDALLYASDDLQKDKEVVLAAVRQYGEVLEYVSWDLRKDKEVVLAAVRQDGDALLYASDDLKKDKEVVLEAVRQDGEVLYYLPEALKNDKEVVLAAVRQSWSALQHASRDLQNDEEVILEANRTKARQSKSQTTGVEGYYDSAKDEVVIIAENTKPQDAIKVGLHEITHRGISKVAKETGGFDQIYNALSAAKNQLMEKSPELLQRSGYESVEDLVLDYGFDVNTKEGELELLMELAARWAETFENESQSPSWWQEILNSIKSWLESFTGRNLSEVEVNELIAGFTRIGADVINETGDISAPQAQPLPTLIKQGEGINNFIKNTQNDDTRFRNRTRWDQSRGSQTLEGAPIIKSRKNVTGANPELNYWAEEYAKRKGIVFNRQSKYVDIDLDRASRIADAYEKMNHSPQDPLVKEAYQNLIDQTIEQYKILQEGGYEFYFFDDTNDPYEGSPWAAMEELRNNKRMGVYITESGFGSGVTDLNVDDNPMLADTGFEWGFGSIEGPKKRVLANDLFRAVHDAFGHGLEGAGFRARGEENAWQAHARLFTGSAVAAITSETRGQNSWLNFNKNLYKDIVGESRAKETHPDKWETITVGEHNNTASVLETIFADQKTGLLPDWTWKEGFDSGDTTSITAAPQAQPLPTLIKQGDVSQQPVTVSAAEYADINLEQFGFENNGDGTYTRQPVTRYSAWGGMDIDNNTRFSAVYDRGDTKKALQYALDDYINNEDFYKNIRSSNYDKGRLLNLITSGEIITENGLEILEEINNNYSNAIGRTSDYRGDIINYILSGTPKIFKPFSNENSVLLGITVEDIFVVSHFAPSSLRNGVELIKEAANSKMPIVMAVPEYQANQLEKAGFTFLTEIPQYFGGQIVVKKVMVNNSFDQWDQDTLINYYKGQTRYSAAPTAEQIADVEREMAGIKEQAINNSTFLKAPNGKDSNLNERQWLQVRTQNFKDWFGDWENDPQNASKVIDENGEPMVVYHGSPNSFNIFERKESRGGLKEHGHFFTTNKKLAEVYGDNIYEVFLNLRDIKTFDARRETNIEAWRNLEVDAGYKIANNRDALDFLKSGDFGVEKVNGVVAENIADLFLGFNPKEEDINKFIGNTYLVFDGNENQIKSATDNVGTFSPATGDIRYSAAEGSPIPFPKEVLVRDSSGGLKYLVGTLENYPTIPDNTEVITRYPNGRYRPNNTRYSAGQEKQISINGEQVSVRPLPNQLEVVNGFYSPIEKALLELNQERGTAAQYLAQIKKAKGVKKDELTFTGIEQYLKEQGNNKIAKQDILDYMKENRIEIVEVVKGIQTNLPEGVIIEVTDSSIVIYDSNNESNTTSTSISGYSSLDEAKKAAIEFYNSTYSKDSSKFSQYQLEGEKENYKEVLVTMPFKNKLFTKRDELSKKQREAFNSGNYELANKIDNEISVITKQLKEQNAFGTEKDFKSDHFEEPNILVHLRMNTRTAADGSKVLFLEELQSDWGQEGKKQGFAITDLDPQRYEVKKNTREKDNREDYVVIDKTKSGFSAEIAFGKSKEDATTLALELINRTAIPQSPFVTFTPSWVKLGIKTAIKEAVNQGATKIAWTTGEQQIERFDLSKRLKFIDYSKNSDGTYDIGSDLEGTSFNDISLNKIEKFYGKEIAEKVKSGVGTESPINSTQTRLEGLDLKVGGSGMKGFYDNIVPKEAKAVVKELTGQEGVVGEVRIEGGENKSLTDQQVLDNGKKVKSIEDAERILISERGVNLYTFENGKAYRLYDAKDISDAFSGDGILSVRTKDISTQQSIEITPELKAVTQQGLPRFSVGATPNPLDVSVSEMLLVMDIYEDMLRQEGYEDADLIMEKLEAMKEKAIYKVSPDMFAVDYNNEVRFIAAGSTNPLDALTFIAHVSLDNILKQDGARAAEKRAKILDSYNKATGEAKSNIDIDVKRFYADAFLSFVKYAVDDKVARSKETKAIMQELFQNMEQEVKGIVEQALEDSAFDKASWNVKKPMLDVFNQLFGRDAKKAPVLEEQDVNTDDFEEGEQRLSKRARTIASQLKVEGEPFADDLIEALNENKAEYKTVPAEALRKLAERFTSPMLLKKDIEQGITDLAKSVQSKLNKAAEPLVKHMETVENIKKLREEGKDVEADALENRMLQAQKDMLKTLYWEVFGLEILMYRLQNQDMKLAVQYYNRYSGLLTNLGRVTGVLGILGPGYEITTVAATTELNKSVGEQTIGNGVKKKSLLSKVLAAAKNAVSQKTFTPNLEGITLPTDTMYSDLAKANRPTKGTGEVRLSAGPSTYSAEEIQLAKFAYYQGMAGAVANPEELYNSNKGNKFAAYDDIVNSDEFQSAVAVEVKDSILTSVTDALTDVKTGFKKKNTNPYRLAANAIKSALKRRGASAATANKPFSELIKNKELTIEVLAAAIEDIEYNTSLTAAERAKAKADAEDVMFTLSESLTKLIDKQYRKENEDLIDQYFSKAKIRKQARESAQQMGRTINSIVQDLLEGELTTSVETALLERAGMNIGDVPRIEKMIREYMENVIASEVEIAYRNELFNTIDIVMQDNYRVEPVKTRSGYTYKVISNKTEKLEGTYSTEAEANQSAKLLNTTTLPTEQKVLAEIDVLKDSIHNLRIDSRTADVAGKQKINKEIRKLEKRLKSLYSRMQTKDKRVSKILDATGKTPSKKDIAEALMYKGGLSDEMMQSISGALGYSETLSLEDIDMLKAYITALREARTPNDRERVLLDMRLRMKKPTVKGWKQYISAVATGISVMTAIGYSATLGNPKTIALALSGGFVAHMVYMFNNTIASVIRDLRAIAAGDLSFSNIRGAFRETGSFFREFFLQGDIARWGTMVEIFEGNRPVTEMSLGSDEASNPNMWRASRTSLIEIHKKLGLAADRETNPAVKAARKTLAAGFFAAFTFAEHAANLLPALDYLVGAGVIRSNLDRSIWDQAMQAKKASKEDISVAKLARDIAEEYANDSALNRLVAEDALQMGVPSVEFMQEAYDKAAEKDKKRLKRELEFVKNWYDKRKAERWLDNFTDRDALAQAIILKNRFTFTGQGTGIFGKIGDGIASFTSSALDKLEKGEVTVSNVVKAFIGTFFVTPLVPFPRMAGRVAQIVFESLPVIGNIDLTKRRKGLSAVTKEEMELYPDDSFAEMISDPSKLMKVITRDHASMWDPKLKQWVWIKLSPTVVNANGMGNLVVVTALSYMLFKALFNWDEDEQRYEINRDYVITDNNPPTGMEKYSVYIRAENKNTYSKVLKYDDIPQIGVILSVFASISSQMADDTSKKRQEAIAPSELIGPVIQGLAAYAASGGFDSVTGMNNIIADFLAPTSKRDDAGKLTKMASDMPENVVRFYMPTGGLGRWAEKNQRYYFPDWGNDAVMPNVYQKTKQNLSGSITQAFEKGFSDNLFTRDLYKMFYGMFTGKNPDNNGYYLTPVGNPNLPTYLTSNLEQFVYLLSGTEKKVQSDYFARLPFPRAATLAIQANPYNPGFMDFSWKEKTKEGKLVIPGTAPAELQRDVINQARLLKGSILNKEENAEEMTEMFGKNDINKRSEITRSFSTAINSHVLAINIFSIMKEYESELGINMGDITQWVKGESESTDKGYSFTPMWSEVVTEDGLTLEQVMTGIVAERDVQYWKQLGGEKTLNLDKMITYLDMLGIYFEHDRVNNSLVPTKREGSNMIRYSFKQLEEILRGMSKNK